MKNEYLCKKNMDKFIAHLQKLLASPKENSYLSFIESMKKSAPKPPRVCAVMIFFFEQDNEIIFPFMLRPAYDGVHSGQISFAGGGQEEQDLDLIQTAIRETEEEIGVLIPRSQILGTLSDIYIPPSNSLVTPVVAYLTEKPTYKIDPKEVDQMLEISLKDLQNPENQSFQDLTFPNKMKAKMPVYQIGEWKIWGATARLLSDLLAK
ncbi:MAG: CoA pyrophosphatase [Bacteroidetes bacterium]|nr:MAG: CoA pyrophosphatase [Bacteroidota bacterium]